MKVKSTLFCLIFLLFLSGGTLAQTYLIDIYGPSVVNVNDTEYYYIDPLPVKGPSDWTPSYHGTESSQLSNSVYITWTTAGSATLEYDKNTFDGHYYGMKNITVNSTAPPTPTGTITSTAYNCGNTVVTRSALSSAASYDWYWQTTSSGTSTANKTTTYSRTSTGALYLRARNKTSPYTWSTNAKYMGNFTVYTSAPSAPGPVTKYVIGDQQVTLQTNPVSGALKYRWYDESNILLAETTAASYTLPGIIDDSEIFRVSAKNGCESAKATITVNHAPEPVISSATNGNCTSIILSVNFTYSDWEWSGPEGLFDTPTIEVNTLGTYRIDVAFGDKIAYATYEVTAAPNMNYVISETMRVPVTNATAISTLTGEEKSRSIVYYDGLGRPIQQVNQQASGGDVSTAKKDIVVPIAYDDFGRQAKDFLPYVDGCDGTYKTNALGPVDVNHPDGYNYPAGDHYDFYQNALYIAHDTKPYAEKYFEPSPLHRVMKQGAAGIVWQPNKTTGVTDTNDRSVKFSYEINTSTDAVKRWELDANGTPYLNGTYAAGELHKLVNYDEHSNRIITFTDKLDQTILKRVQANTTATLWVNTYYIYDIYNKLRFVFPPEVDTKTSVTSTVINGLAFQYKYDDRGRMIAKRVPGSEWIYMVYDQWDRLVLTQDGNQRLVNEWTYTKYDVLNRPVLTGVMTWNNTQEYIQAWLYTKTSAQTPSIERFETFNNALTYDYTMNKSFPVEGNSDGYTIGDVLTITYYDNYSFTSVSFQKPLNIFTYEDNKLDPVKNTSVKGQVTGSKTNILGTSNFITTINFYDDRYRLIQTYSDNQGIIDRHTTQYDFAGQVRHTHLSHTNPQGVPVTIRTEKIFEYDHAGRVERIYHQVDDMDSILLVQNEYNALGELIDKKLYSEDETTFAQSVDYRYNIRGWLTRINNSELNDGEDDYFGMNLGYNDNLGLGSSAAYNGNISAVKWQNGYDLENRGYGYSYDPMNRILGAQYKVGTTSATKFSVSGITYDLNGNIKTLTRKNETGGNLDILGYTYMASSNRLNKVADTEDKTNGFKDGTNTGNDYYYDDNGNMKKDLNKDITDIEYNHLNLPKKVIKDLNNYIEYTYDAAGIKLSQTVYESGNSAKTTIYAGEFIYKNDTLQLIQHEEGRLLPPLQSGSGEWEYQFHLKDHLGNTRVTFATKLQELSSSATMELSESTTESQLFMNYDEVTKVNAKIFDHTNKGKPEETGYSVRLNGSEKERTGLAQALKVSRGDTIKAEVYVKYVDNDKANWTAAMNGLMNAIASGGNASGIGNGIDKNPVVGNGNSFDPSGALTNQATEKGQGIYLNAIFFDKEMNYKKGIYKKLSDNPKENGSDVEHEKLSVVMPVEEEGYVYVYYSNESTTMTEAYFDDFTITSISDYVIQADDYYPFGLSFNSYKRAGAKENKMNTFQDQEIIKDLDLNWVQFKWRNHDPAIGRFFNVDPLAEDYYYNSPYAFSENKVISHVEIEGLEAENFMAKFKAPNELAVKRPSENAQRQSFSVSVKNPKRSFTEVRKSFLSQPHKLLSNSKADFNSPVDGEGNDASFAEGNFIKIDIVGPLNNGFVKIEDITSEENMVSASFVTMEGHVEKGEITFSITTDKDGNITFSINSKSDVDQGAAKLVEGYSRSQQADSWLEVLTNFVNMTGGEETSRQQEIEEEE